MNLTIQSFLRQHGLFVLAIFVPLIGFDYFGNDAQKNAYEIFNQNRSGEMAAAYWCLIAFIDLLLLLGVNIVTISLWRIIFWQNEEQAKIRRSDLISFPFWKNFAIWLMLGFFSYAFIVLAVMPMFDLAFRLRWGRFGTISLFALTLLPLALWAGHYAFRIALVLPAHALGRAFNMRQALHKTENIGKLILKIELGCLGIYTFFSWLYAKAGEPEPYMAYWIRAFGDFAMILAFAVSLGWVYSKIAADQAHS